jgi:hypothetical protein
LLIRQALRCPLGSPFFRHTLRLPTSFYENSLIWHCPVPTLGYSNSSRFDPTALP